MGSDQRYEEIPYRGRAFTQTHPSRLASLAHLFGVAAAHPATCRVLEIGCGDGGNLIPMAHGLPEATFVGIDTSASAIGAARARAQELGLHNVTFEEMSLADHAPAAGSFDYVVAHGVYSWVDAALRDALLALSARALSEHGVAYVSYNALPGGRLRQALREILAQQLAGIDDPSQRIAAARERLALLRSAWAYDENLATLGLLATKEIEADDALLYHDTLSPHNTPLYFHEFVAQAAAHDLQFLAEANFWEMQIGWLPPDVRPALMAVDDRLRREQELDFMRMRTFRQTLLCHAAQPIREIAPERLEDLAAAAWLTADEPSAEGEVTFRGRRGQVLTTAHPHVIGALRRLGDAWPAAPAIAGLWPDGTEPDDRAAVCEMLLRCYGADLVTLHAAPLPTGGADAERPRTSALARLQARDGATVTNRRHEPVELDDAGRLLVSLLDGRRDRGALRAALAAAHDGAGDEEIAAALEDGLRELARRALLLPEP